MARKPLSTRKAFAIAGGIIVALIAGASIYEELAVNAPAREAAEERSACYDRLINQAGFDMQMRERIATAYLNGTIC